MILNRSPLQLESSWVPLVYCHANPDAEIEDQSDCVPERLEHKTSASLGEDKKWALHLELKSDDSLNNKQPYKFHIIVLGFFIIADDSWKGSIEKLIRINGFSMLYSIARQVLLATSSLSPYPPILLPTMQFLMPTVETGVVETEAEQKKITKSKSTTPRSRAKTKKVG